MIFFSVRNLFLYSTSASPYQSLYLFVLLIQPILGRNHLSQKKKKMISDLLSLLHPSLKKKKSYTKLWFKEK